MPAAMVSSVASSATFALLREVRSAPGCARARTRSWPSDAFSGSHRGGYSYTPALVLRETESSQSCGSRNARRHQRETDDERRLARLHAGLPRRGG